METVQIVAFVFGAIFFAILLKVILKHPNPTESQYTFLRIMLALACSCVAVVLTGFLTVTIKDFIQAGGALAVFVIVYFYNPPALLGSSPWREIKDLWKDARGIKDNPNEANDDDVAKAINLVNESGRIVLENSAILNSFTRDYKSSFCRLYLQLSKNGYQVDSENNSSENLLSPAARSLAEKLGC